MSDEKKKPTLLELADEVLMTDQVDTSNPNPKDVEATKKPSLAVIANALGHGGSSGY